MSDSSNHADTEKTSGADTEVSGVETSLQNSALPLYWHTEQVILMLNVLKWAFLGVLVGILSGLAVHLYEFLLDSGSSLRNTALHNHLYLFLFLPFILILCTRVSLMLTRPEEHVPSEGTDAVIQAIHEKSGRLRASTIPVRILLNLFTLTFGGSVGKEGPAAQIGAATSSVLADLLRISDEDRRRLVICGVAAGFAAIFGTPISGAVFGVEVLYTGQLEYPVLFPCILGGIVAQLVCGTPPPIVRSMFATQIFHDLNTLELTLLALASGVFFGLVALLFIEMLRYTDKFFSRFRSRPYLVSLMGGLAIAMLYLLFGANYAGLSETVLHNALNGKLYTMPGALLSGIGGLFLAGFLVKITATSLSLKTGGVGGIMTPIFFVGATSGAALGIAFHLPAMLLARFGFVAMVAAAANTPIAAVVMGLEVLGGPIGMYAALCSCTAYLIVGHRSVFAEQRLGYSKAVGLLPTLDIPIGELNEYKIQLHPDYRLGKVLRRKNKG